MHDSKSRQQKPINEVHVPKLPKHKLERIGRERTRQKRILEQVSTNEIYEKTFLSLNSAVFILDNKMPPTIVECNPAAMETFGYKRKEVIGKTTEFLHIRQKALEEFQSVLFPAIENQGFLSFFEYRMKRKNGDIFPTEHSVLPLKDHEDNQIGWISIVKDITEHMKAEEQLEQSREFLANTINALDDSFFVKDEEHKWTILNDAACEAIGCPREELVGKSDYDLFPKDQADEFWEKDNLVLETGETNVSEEEVTWQGKLHTISTKKSLFKDYITGKRFIVGTARDITERKQMEKTLRESEHKYRALVEQSLHGIVILQDYRIIFANAAAMEIAGLTIDETQSLTLEEMMAFIPPENQAAIKERLMNRFAGKDEPGNYELRLVRRNGGEFWLNLLFTNIEYEGKFAIHLAFADITERKRAEEALRWSEKRFRDFFENTAVGMYRTTPDGRILMANPALVHMLGHSSFEELSQRNLEEEGFEPQYRRSMFRKEIEHKGRIVSWESIWTTREGKKLYVIENARAVKDEDNKILYYEGTAENITERKKAEEALRESEQRYRAIFEQAADSIVLIDVETGELVEFNDRTHKNLGYTREEFQNLKIPDFEAIESAEEIRKHLENIIKTGADTFETRQRTKDGDIRDVQIRSRAISIRDKDFVQSIWHDITERKKAEEKLKIREQTLRAFLNAPTESAILIDTEGTILDINRIAAQRLGKSADRLIGMSIYDYLPTDIAEYRKARGAEVVRSGKPLRFQDERAGRHYDNNVYPVFDDERRVSALAVFSGDITEKKRSEERLLEYQGQLKSLASELTLAEERERHRIATDLHDEISQSLFISKMKLEAIHKSASGKKADDTLGEISNSLGEIITAMRSLTFDLSSPILYEFGFEEAVAEWLNERVEKKYGIATEFEDDGLPKPLDDDIRVLLFRNVRELLINVVKHAHASKVKVSIGKVGVLIRISVEDDGLGFDTSKADTMITNKEAFGLFSIRERLEHFGGNLEIESESGCGCRITITSPLSREKISKDKRV